MLAFRPSHILERRNRRSRVPNESKATKLSRQERTFVETVANQTSLAIIRAELEDEARNADVLSNADRLQKALLHAISHNVRTPLASIIGVLSTLREQDGSIEPEIYRDLLDTAQEQAHRLNRLLGNLFDLSRLEAGGLQVRSDPCDIQDLIGSALEQIGLAAGERRIDVKLPPNLSVRAHGFRVDRPGAGESAR